MLFRSFHSATSALIRLHQWKGRGSSGSAPSSRWSSESMQMLLPGRGCLSGSLRGIPVFLIGHRRKPRIHPAEEVASKPLIHAAHAASSCGQGAIVTLPAFQIIPIWPHAPKASAIARGRHILACPFGVLQIFLLNTNSFSITFHAPSCPNSNLFLSYI